MFACGDRRMGKSVEVQGTEISIMTHDDKDFISLTEHQIEEYTRRFGEIEQFTGQEPELEPHMTILAF